MFEKRKLMTKYYVAIHRPNAFDPSVSVDEAMRREIDALNEEMVAAGVRVFVGGLRPTSNAKSLQRLSDGELLISDGSYLKTSEYVDGFWVLEVADLDESLRWGRKAAAACQASVEVRPFH